MTEQGRFDPAPLGRRILARSGRLARAGGARFASRAVSRHRNPTLGRRPRLLPVRAIASPGPSEYSPAPAAAEQPVAQPPVAVPRPGGISEEAAKWLFLGELRPNLAPLSALKPAPLPVTRKMARSEVPRPRLEEGPSVRPTSAGTPLPRSPQAEPRAEAVPEIDQIRGAQPDALADAAEPVVEGGAEPAGEAQPAEPGTAARTPLSRSVTGPSPSQSASAALARAAPTPAGPSAPAAQVPTGTALSREPPKVRDKAEKTSAAEKALGDATHSEPAATAVPAPIARSARPLRRLRPAGPARRVAPKPSLSVSREPRDPRRAESEVVAGAPTRDSVPTPDAATDGDAAPARGETVIEQATESGAGKAPDVADGTPLDRSVSTSREAERPTALARKASASEAGLEPSTGSAPVVANAPAAGTTAGGRSDEPVATPPGKPAAPPADMQAPATSEASPVTSAEAPA